MTALRAELFALRRRPGVRGLTLVWCAQLAVFAYLASYLVYRAVPDLDAAEAARLRDALLPSAIDTQTLVSMPVYGGPVMLALGAVIGAGDFRWGTLRTILARSADRLAFLRGRLLAVAVLMAVVAALTLAVSAACSLAVALADGAPVAWPGAGDLLLALGSLFLVDLAWAATGLALGVVTRSVAAAAGVGLAWTLVVENAVGGLAAVVPGLEVARGLLLSGATGSLVSAVTDRASGLGVSAAIGGPAAALVLAGWVALAVLVAALTLRRRDVL